MVSLESDWVGNARERVVRSLSTFITEALIVISEPSAPGIQMDVVSCAAAHDTRSAVEKILDIMMVVGRKRLWLVESGKEGRIRIHARDDKQLTSDA